VAHVRRFATRVGRAAKSLKSWTASADQGYVAIGGNAKVLTQSRVVLSDETVLRTRGIVSSAPGAHSADTNVIGAYGFAYVSEQAAAAGVASIPGPYTDAAWDGWFVHGYYNWDFEFGTAVGIQTPGSVQQEFDSKAMRKGSSNDRVVVIVESRADAQLVSIQFRQLVKVS